MDEKKPLMSAAERELENSPTERLRRELENSLTDDLKRLKTLEETIKRRV